jgi:phage FluMu protein Com
MIYFRCGKCKKLLRVADKEAGRLGKCPACKEIFRVPKQSTKVPPVSARSSTAARQVPSRQAQPPARGQPPAKKKATSAPLEVRPIKVDQPPRRPQPPPVPVSPSASARKKQPPPQKEADEVLEADEVIDDEVLEADEVIEDEEVLEAAEFVDDEEEERPRKRGRREEEEEEEEEDDRPRSKEKKSKKPGKRKSGRQPTKIGWVTPVLALAGVALLVVAAMWHRLLMIPGFLGIFMIIYAWVWLIVEAFREDGELGVKCLSKQYYTIYFIATRFRTLYGPLLMILCGALILLTTCGLGIWFGDIHG